MKRYKDSFYSTNKYNYYNNQKSNNQQHYNNNNYNDECYNKAFNDTYYKSNNNYNNKHYKSHHKKNYHKKKIVHYSKKDVNAYLTSLNLPIPELTTNLINSLIDGNLECLICQEEILHSSRIWQCGTCYTIIHIECIYDWIYKKNSSEESKTQFKWNCPHCNNQNEHSSEELPLYNCFCGKYNDYASDPYFDPSSIMIPHTCGLNCEYIVCEHTFCNIPCHPGPHLPCNVIEDRYCHCGKDKKQIACANPHKSFSCMNICDKVYSCGRHKCVKICHEGDCIDDPHKKCRECIRESKAKFQVFLQQLESKIKIELNEEVKIANHLSDYIFEGKLMCGFHYVEPNTDENLKFLLKIVQISGKNLVENIKKFIPVCKEKVNNACDCKSKCKETICYKLYYDDDLLKFIGLEKEKEIHLQKCNKVCRTLKTCKYHECNRVCCSLKNKNIRTLNQDPQGYHFCMLICGKTLNCGIHQCDEYCHKNCKPCTNIIREKTLVCECGKTKLEPPYVCGSVPICLHPCSKTKPCGHPCPINCHEGPCPPCEELVFKYCECKKEVFQDVPCSQICHCKTECGSILPCGAHFCKRICHDHDEKFDENYFCVLECGRALDCGHPCKMKCHGDDDCNQIACQAVIRLYCKCKTNSINYKCGEAKKRTTQEIECNAECQKKERLRKIETMFNDLLKFSNEKNKIFNKKETKLEYLEDIDLENNKEPKYVDIKWDYKLVWLAMNKPKLIIDIERIIEKAVRNQSKQYIINDIDKKMLPLINDYLTLNYNLKVDKYKSNDSHLKSLKIIDASNALLPRYKLSLFGVLFKQHNFIRNKDFYHPFEFTIEIRNYNSYLDAEEIEKMLIKYANKNDFYLVEISKGTSYVHFFTETNGKRVFKILKEFPNVLQECYPITYENTADSFSYENLYMYLRDDIYYKGLITQEEIFRYRRNYQEEKEEDEYDEDGFLKVKNKNKKKV